MPSEHTERRLNPLTGEWVLNSQGRNDRPWTGQVEKKAVGASDLHHDASCPLCPGVIRANGVGNPDYSGVFVFDNDFPAVKPETPAIKSLKGAKGDLFQAKIETGLCKVICFSPSHSLTLARLPETAVQAVVQSWCDETEKIAESPDLNSVQIFENRGAIMGCSNPHPHGQIWAQAPVPTELGKELRSMDEYYIFPSKFAVG